MMVVKVREKKGEDGHHSPKSPSPRTITMARIMEQILMGVAVVVLKQWIPSTMKVMMTTEFIIINQSTKSIKKRSEVWKQSNNDI